ncbi:MAG: GDP-mannose 4,6-dehydratase [bacterium]
MTKALITGGCGVIGSHLIDALLDRGAFVTVIDNLSTGKITNVEHNLDNPRLHLINDSILNEALMDELIRDCTVVFHLAAAVGVKYICDDPLRGILTNVRGAEIVFACAFKYWKRVVFASTSEVYGRSDRIPFAEDGERVLGPTFIDRWSYSTGKAVDEHLAFAYSRKGLAVSVLRYFNSYGPRIDESGYGSVAAKFISQALRGAPITVHGDGRQTRCFTYIDDTIRGTLLAAESSRAKGEAFNIGSNRETSIEELAHMVREITGSPSKIVHVPYEDYYGEYYEDTRRRIPNIEKAGKMLGFEPVVELEEGLAKTVDWAKKHYKLKTAVEVT